MKAETHLLLETARILRDVLGTGIVDGRVNDIDSLDEALFPWEGSELSRTVIAEIAAERHRQVEVEGFDAGHDSAHQKGELAVAAACYSLHGLFFNHRSAPICDLICVVLKYLWPWGEEWFKPRDHRRNLIRAGALIVAEIERLDRDAQRVADHD